MYTDCNYPSNTRLNFFGIFSVAHHRQCDWNELLREFEILQHVNATGHRNIIKLIGACSKTGMQNTIPNSVASQIIRSAIAHTYNAEISGNNKKFAIKAII